MYKNLKVIFWIAGVFLFLFLAGYLYSVFFKPVSGIGVNITGLLLIGLLLGAVISYLFLRLTQANAQIAVVKESSHTIVESMRKVFKVVCAEGQFQEIYDYEETVKLLRFIPSTKKAMVIVTAKVLIGYDFEKCRWTADENTKRIKITAFPEPEILSLEPSYKYYSFEENIFNPINRDDLHHIQAESRKQVEQAALNSGLKKLAAEQMRTMLTEVVKAYQWQLENTEMISLPPSAPVAEAESAKE